jgi:alpha-amylase
MKKFMRLLVSVSAASALIFSAVTATNVASAAGVVAPNKPLTNQSVGIQMFMWNWRALKNECSHALGPAGVDWILVSPPQESVRGSNWWVHYQPVSYKIDSNLGTRAEFADMVKSCNTAGVGVVVDAVINHMANSSGVGFAGTSFQKYNYPGLYSAEDFHSGLSRTDPRYCNMSISNYNDPYQNVNCELGGLPDLATEKPSVRAKIVGYLNDLLGLGVSGFRIDAAKHFGIEDLTAVQNAINKTTAGMTPIWLSETVGGKNENAPFAVGGQVFGWSWVDAMQSYFAPNFGSAGRGQFVDARKAAFDYKSSIFGSANPGLLTGNGSAQTVTMVSNHDTEHHGPSSLTYNDDVSFQEATVFTIVDSFGLPMIYSGYAFSDENAGPPTRASGYIKDASCLGPMSRPLNRYVDGKFVCVERWTAVKGAIAWKDAVGTNPQTATKVLNVKKTGASLLSYKRGEGSFIGFNDQVALKKQSVSTGLPSGVYCDYITGGTHPVKSASRCVGTKVSVNSQGKASLTLPANSVVALSSNAKLG